jgi:hypothetical protein
MEGHFVKISAHTDVSDCIGGSVSIPSGNSKLSAPDKIQIGSDLSQGENTEESSSVMEHT